MVFSSMVFLWIFLPIVLVLYKIAPYQWKNYVLLSASLIFYSWGEPKYILLLLLSAACNYLFGIVVGRQEGGAKKASLALCVAFNLGLLGYFKYFNFFIALYNKVFGAESLALREVALPLGISFYTFQILSYVVDVYRGETEAQGNFPKLLLYIVLFPQLIAGPIVKYKDVERQLGERAITPPKTAYGIKRFLYGLAKKVLLSNSFAVYADLVFTNLDKDFSAGVLWAGAVFYTLQIYYDFSGYSDMAIGLGKMFGFDFLENFNYPYLAASVREFWRRWHISLSTWFREYVYIPLGGNRKGAMRTYGNLMAVFFLTGFWHGAGLNFIAWGLYYGFFLIMERLFLGKLLEKNPIKLLNHMYTLLVVAAGWVLFRCEGLKEACAMLFQMFTFQPGEYQIGDMASLYVVLLLAAGILFSGPLQEKVRGLKESLYEEGRCRWQEYTLLFALFFCCIAYLVSDTYNPFIYFRF